MNKNMKIGFVILVISVLSVGIIISTLPPKQNNPSFLMDLFASWGMIEVPNGEYALAGDQIIGNNNTVVKIGTVNNTKLLNNLKYGLEIKWVEDIGRTVELCVILAFTLPPQINQTTIVNYYANITFYVTLVHNGTYDWAFRIPAIDGPLSDGMGGWVPWWRDGTATDNETFAVEISVDNYDYFIPYVNENNEVLAKFTVIIEGHIGDFTQLLIDFGKVTIWQ